MSFCCLCSLCPVPGSQRLVSQCDGDNSIGSRTTALDSRTETRLTFSGPGWIRAQTRIGQDRASSVPGATPHALPRNITSSAGFFLRHCLTGRTGPITGQSSSWFCPQFLAGLFWRTSCGHTDGLKGTPKLTAVAECRVVPMASVRCQKPSCQGQGQTGGEEAGWHSCSRLRLRRGKSSAAPRRSLPTNPIN